MAIEIVDLPIKHGGSFHSYVTVCHFGYLKPQTRQVEGVWAPNNLYLGNLVGGLEHLDYFCIDWE